MRSPFQLLETSLQGSYRAHRRIILRRRGLGGRPWADTEIVCSRRGKVQQSGSKALRKKDAGWYFSVPDLGMIRWD